MAEKERLAGWGALLIEYHCIQYPDVMMTALKQDAKQGKQAKPVRLNRPQRMAVLKALADPKRFELLERIASAQCPLSCSSAGEALAISAATLSHHIKELQTSGLIEVRREGKFHFLSMKPGVLEALAFHLQSISAQGCQTN